MEDGQLVDLLKREELEATVGPLSSWLHLGSRQPVPQGLGRHPKHLATDGKRKGCGHEISFARMNKHRTRASRRYRKGPGNSLYLIDADACRPGRSLSSFQTTISMVIAGTTAVASSPPRPGKNQHRTTRKRPDEISKQMTHFRNGERSYTKRRKRGRGGVCRSLVLATDRGQEGMSQHHEGDVTIPSRPTSDLILIESHIFGCFKILLYVPACSNCLHHLLQGGSFRRKDEIVRFFGWIVHAAAHEHPMLPIILPVVQDGNGCPIKDARPFGALAHRKALPILGSKQECFHVADFYQLTPIRSLDTNGFVAGDCQHVGVLIRLEPGTQSLIAPIHGISHDPRDGNMSMVDALDHLSGQLTLCLETNSIRNIRLLTALTILYPFQRKVEFTVDERMALGRHVAEKDPDLTVFEISCGPAILLFDAR